jgi:Tfp pilus assembly protein PilN
MACQHKRPGATARQERVQRAKERELARLIRERTIVQFPSKRKQWDGFPGRIMAIGIPPEMEGIA